MLCIAPSPLLKVFGDKQYERNSVGFLLGKRGSLPLQFTLVVQPKRDDAIAAAIVTPLHTSGLSGLYVILATNLLFLHIYSI